MGAGGAAAVVAAIVAGVSLQHSGERTPKAPDRADGFEVCLKEGWSPVEGAAGRCFTPDEAAMLAERPVLDDDGAPVSLSLSHPSDRSRELAIADNCAAWRRLAAEGWFALSTREMRREAWFVRACGTLALLEGARLPRESHFAEGALTEADLRSLAGSGRFRIGPVSEGGSGEVAIDRDGAAWRLFAAGSRARLQEIAHADFNEDGRGDMLVFIVTQAEGGTATASAVGILDKPAAEGPVTFIDRADLR